MSYGHDRTIHRGTPSLGATCEMKDYLDLATLKVVHEFYEFEAKTDLQFDIWLHRQILRAKLQRELTVDEEKAFLGAGDNALQE